ncbi:four-helix bundle copper-binding protein [Actinocorallia populi]|uniref:four-helix bundle copper-binding protein n=1 Tax=Actinocorallia populi TaxID=2079200 RepID=UPI000D08F34A|nr:four-helix bundle copper-binding protein [Actinocorallia populi]
MSVTRMLETYPATINMDRKAIADTVEILLECSQACTACADACLSEQDVADLAKCIRTDLDCADICDTTARVLSRHTGYDANITRAQLQACAQACSACATECERHAGHHEHCRACAEVCRRCAEACRGLLAKMS